MRVLFITGKYPPTPCGIGDHSRRLASELAKKGHEIRVFTSSSDTNEVANNHHGCIDVIREATKWDFADYRSILSLLRHEKIELIHIQYHSHAFNCHPMITLLPMLLKKEIPFSRVKVVVTLHELTGPITWALPGPTRRIWLLPLMFFSNANIVTNERDMFYLQKILFLSKKLHYIPFSSNVDVRFASKVDRGAVRTRLGVGDSEILLVRFGFVNNVRVSLLPELLYSVKMLVDKGYKVKMLFIGGESVEGRSEVFTLARSLGITGHIVMRGYCSENEVSECLSAADIGVQPYPEGICEKRGSLQAAMLHGLPVVSTQNGRVPSMFSHRENVMLAPVRDTVRMAEAIEALINDVELRKTLGRNAAKLNEIFNWQTNCQRTETLYQRLLRDSRRQV